MAKQIGTVIIQNLLLDLKAAFADSPNGDVGEVGLIKQGRLQADPEQLHITITVHVSDPDAPEKWTDTVFARRDGALDRSQFESTTWQVGSRGSTWWRRGTVMWEFFGTKTQDTEDEAQRKAGVIEGRIQQAIDQSVHVPGCHDDFGESVISIMSVSTQKSEGSGPPDQYIWRGKVWWQAFTGRS